MATILKVSELQEQLDNAARDAKHGPAAIRAGKFVHQDALAKLPSTQNGRALPGGRKVTETRERRPSRDLST